MEACSGSDNRQSAELFRVPRDYTPALAPGGGPGP
jgi:hypothetical protein